jgi:hypothetical protein
MKRIIFWNCDTVYCLIKVTEISEERSAPIFRTEEQVIMLPARSKQSEFTRTHYVPLKRPQTCTKLTGIRLKK